MIYLFLVLKFALMAYTGIVIIVMIKIPNLNCSNKYYGLKYVISDPMVVVCGMQEWVKQPSGVSVNPGEEAVLACRLLGKKGDCRWERNGLPVGLYPGKYEWAGSPIQGDCSLRVREASLQYDAGDWVCQVTASSFMEKDTLISSPARLLVRGEII